MLVPESSNLATSSHHNLNSMIIRLFLGWINFDLLAVGDGWEYWAI
jgi:hypothetical protein